MYIIVNNKDYESWEIDRFLNELNSEKISSSITNRHVYVVKYYGKIISMGGVAKDSSQESQSYFTGIFINPDHHRMGIGRELFPYKNNIPTIKVMLKNVGWIVDSFENEKYVITILTK